MNQSSRPRCLHIGALCAALLVTGAIEAVAETAAHPWNQRVPFETAIIRYEMKGKDPGTKVMYLRARGDERVTVTRSQSADSATPGERHTIEISTPSEITRIEMGTRTALRAPNKLATLIDGYNTLGDADKKAVMNAAADIRNRFPALRGRPEPVSTKDKFLGYDCDVVEIAGITSHYIEGTNILLKSEGIQGTIRVETVATQVDTAAPIPEDVFTVPAEVKVRDLRELQSASIRQAAEKELAALRAPPP
ncbi:MAG TPA: hypothetical protein VEC57_19105 [Candidatus Limnocylindrales bacterium]|nr:hypothetical protein [Candidatus Limnocylindrales bacterium]